MGVLRLAGALGAVALLTSACVEPPVKPIPDASRRTVLSISGDVSGVKDSDTSKLGARGSAEGGRMGAAQGAAVTASSGSLLGLLLMPVGAAVGGAKGAAEAQTEDAVDATRNNLRMAIQQTDFSEMLRSRLEASKAAGDIQIVGITNGSATAPLQATNGGPAPSHVLALEYGLNIYGESYVNPQIGIRVVVKAQVLSTDRKQVIHQATWAYCGERRHFVEMGYDRLRARWTTPRPCWPRRFPTISISASNRAR